MSLPAVCDHKEGCAKVQRHDERLGEAERRLDVLEEDNKALHKRITDHLVATIAEMNTKVVLLVTAGLSAAGVIISLIALFQK